MEPVWACTPGKSGCTPLDECARARSSPLGLVSPGTWLYDPGRPCYGLVGASSGVYAAKTTRLHVCTCTFQPVWGCTPRKTGCTSLYECALPVGARLGLYDQETWLYAPGRGCAGPFVSVWVCTPPKQGFKRVCTCTFEPDEPLRPENLAVTPPGVCARACWSPFGPVRAGNLAVRPWASGHVPVGACTPGKPCCTSLDKCARARSCQFGVVLPKHLTVPHLEGVHRSCPLGPARHGSLAERLFTCVHVPVSVR